MKTPKKDPRVALNQSLKNELSRSGSFNGWWIPIQDKVGLWIEKGNGVYFAELYMNELDLRICAPGVGVVISSPPELWIHASLGLNGWDQYKNHKWITALTLTEKPPESSWKRIEVFKVRFDELKPYVSQEETIENGYFEGFAVSDEKADQFVYPTIYHVKVRGNLAIDDKYRKFINTTLYYTEKRGFKKGEKIMGYVKLVTIRAAEKPVIYLSAIGNGYWIDRISPWINNVTAQKLLVEFPIQLPLNWS